MLRLERHTFGESINAVELLPDGRLCSWTTEGPGFYIALEQGIFDDPWAVALGGVAAVAGHMFPIFARFRGGRGAATAFGAFAVIAPIAGAVLIVCAAIALAATRYASLTTITATAAGCASVVALVVAGWLPVHYLLFAFAVTASIELGHIGNIRRLINGVEPKLGQGGAPRVGGA